MAPLPSPLLRPSFRLFSHSPRYRSYPSLNVALTLELKMSSPRGFCAGGIGARGTPRATGAAGGGGLVPGERETGEPGGERFPRRERVEEDEWEEEEDVRRERGVDDGGVWEVLGGGEGEGSGERWRREARKGKRVRVRVLR